MPELTEMVDLPDASVQPLVHPLDLREARWPFRRAQLIAALTNPAVATCVAGIIWFGSRSFLVPLISGCVIAGFGALAARLAGEQAWAFIPRKRQDRARALPLTWELGSALVLAVVLAVALVLMVFRLDQFDTSLRVRQFAFGAGAMTGLLMVGEVIIRLVGGQGRRALLTVPGLLAVAGGVIAGYLRLFGSVPAVTTSTAVAGAISMLVVGVGIGVWKHLEERRRTSAP